MKKINICIADLGNVGSSLVDSLASSKENIKLKSNIEINILAVSAKNKNKKRDCDISSFKWLDNPLDLLSVKNCDVLVELIANEKGTSYELVKSALENKINVVSGNKAMIALHGSELFKKNALFKNYW